MFFGKNIPSTASRGIPDLFLVAFDRLSAAGLSLPVPHHQKLLEKVQAVLTFSSTIVTPFY